jgi:hypothetical protein
VSATATEVKRGWRVHRATVSHGLFWVEGTNYETEKPKPLFWQIGEHSFIGQTRYNFSACEFGPGAKEEYVRLVRRAAAEAIGRTGLQWLATECREGASPDYLRESLDRAYVAPGGRGGDSDYVTACDTIKALDVATGRVVARGEAGGASEVRRA